MPDFTRPSKGFPFVLDGIKTNSVANNISPDKSPYCQNLRSLGGSSARVRPGTVLQFSTGAHAITDIRAYATLQTDNKPRFLARDTTDAIWLDNGVQVGSLTAGNLGAAMMPFRPNQSPQAWMYIANGKDYQKFSAPDGSNSVTQRKVGIAEPQSPPEACTDTRNVFKLVNSDNAGSWTNAGQAGAPAAVARGSADTAVAFLADPASISPITPRFSMQVGTSQYQIGEFINVAISGGGSAPMTVDDVFPAISSQSTITIQSIVYFSGSTGRCVIQPNQIPEDSLSAQGGAALAISIGANGSPPQTLSALRRGSLIVLNSGGGNQETVFVLSVTVGPQGQTAIECSTTNTHVATETINGVNALSITTGQATGTLVGQAITSVAIQSAIGAAGTGTLALAISAGNNPFTHQGIPSLTFLPTPQEDDYIHISLNIADLTKITDIQIQFDVGDGSFTQNYLYYDVQANALNQAVSGASTQLGATQLAAQQAIARDQLSNISPRLQIETDLSNTSSSEFISVDNISPSTITTLGTSQWSEILFTLADLTRVGGDMTKTLANCNGIRIQVIATAAFTFQMGSIWVGAGGQPDVGDVGALYRYRVRPRDSRTGVKGNPSPATRYGVIPRRQFVIVPLPSAAYDSQIDTWDIFRWGGSVTSWRYIGSAPSGATTFTDNTFDDAVRGGDLLEEDNFEPWPSVDFQFSGTAATVCGTLALVSIAAATGCSPTRWLPGTGVILGQNLAYTLRIRPVLVSGTTYRLEFIECANQGTNVAINVMEPALANQMLPYMAGPDEEGRFLACGDPLRPGTIYYSKPNNPDSCPDTYNRDITDPSNPLLGIEIVDGRAWVANPEFWWELLPQQSTNPTEFYNPVKSSLTRGLVAPYAHCNDGANLYWYAKDGIMSSQGSLTDADLYNIFPFEGRTPQTYTYAGNTIQPPDYQHAGMFRLAHGNGFLYAIYADASGNYHMLTCDLKHGQSWMPDVYPTQISVAYHVEQQSGTVLTNNNLYQSLLFGNVSGQVLVQQKDTNDQGTPIPCSIFSFEYDGGDARAPKQWGDFFVDLVPNANLGVTASCISLGAILVGTTQTISKSTSRQRIPLSVGGIVVSDFMGLELAWSDDFQNQTSPTVLNLWEPSYDIQPAYQIAWQSFGSSWGISGFGHIPWMEIAYVSTQAITITITCVDGTSPSPIVLPSSGGVYTKAFFRLTFNKGRLYNFQGGSTAKFQIFEEDCCIMWAPWGRSGSVEMKKNLGVPQIAESVV